MTKKELIKLYVDTHLVMESQSTLLNTAFSAVYSDNAWVSVVPDAYAYLLDNMLGFICTEDEVDWLSYYMYEVNCAPFVYWLNKEERTINSFDEFYDEFFGLNKDE